MKAGDGCLKGKITELYKQVCLLLVYSLWADPSPSYPGKLHGPPKVSWIQLQLCGQFQESISVRKVFKNITLKLTDFKELKLMLKVKQDYTKQG